jgi:hypothetical protein
MIWWSELSPKRGALRSTRTLMCAVPHRRRSARAPRWVEDCEVARELIPLVGRVDVERVVNDKLAIRVCNLVRGNGRVHRNKPQ